MRSPTFLPPVLLFSLLASAAPSSKPVIHDKRTSLPGSPFTNKGVAPLDAPITLSINLASSNLPGLESKLLEVSTPGSDSFRQWLSKEDVGSYVEPTREARQAVDAWLSSHGIEHVAAAPGSSNWIMVTVPISKANEMLSTTYESYHHTPSGRVLNRVMEYSMPENVAPFVKAIYPTTSFDIYKDSSSHTPPPPSLDTASWKAKGNNTKKRDDEIPPSTGAAAALCDLPITPACVLDLYKIPANPAVSVQSRVGIASMYTTNASFTDLSLFLQAYRPDADASTRFKVVSVDGTTNDPSNPGFEGNLDIQWSLGIAPRLPNEFFMISTKPTNPYLDLATFLLAQDSPPQVFTVSYGLDKESDLSLPLTKALCDTYMQLAARGVSILWASGDGGVAATPGNKCSARDRFIPTFPTCPFITLVGSTQDVPEIGAQFSAGGFSSYFGAPSYQTAAVQAYLTQYGNKNSGRYNKTGRAYPDIAAQGSRMRYSINGDAVTNDSWGTSFSSPILAAMFALLNGELIQAGKPVLGFLNPWLYSHPEMFNDITSGENLGCGPSGFPALKGWDPVTGMGTPNYAAMRIAAGLS